MACDESTETSECPEEKGSFVGRFPTVCFSIPR
jgi:hypothetical protein